mgnify:CR=1 FL=1
MTNFIPIFPLELVVFPGEPLNLHIFEPRYKQLVRECFDRQKLFGMPSVINNKLGDFGTTILVKEVFKTYDNGEMDIKTEARQVFRILEVIKDVPDKLYSGAIVNYPACSPHGNDKLMKCLIENMRVLHQKLGVNKKFSKNDKELNTYDIAHHSGLTIEQEYELLQLTSEKQRQQYLKRHFENTSQVLAEQESIKEKIQMNGHFKELNSRFDF